MPVAHKQGADRSGSGDPGPPRVFGSFLRVEKGTAPPRAVAARKKLDEFKKNAQQIKKSYENFKIRSILKFFAKKKKALLIAISFLLLL